MVVHAHEIFVTNPRISVACDDSSPLWFRTAAPGENARDQRDVNPLRPFDLCGAGEAMGSAPPEDAIVLPGDFMVSP